MDKVILLEKIKKQNYSHKQLLAWVTCLPGTSYDRRPTEIKVGDVFMHPIFKHPLIVLKKKKEDYICSILTSESNCSEILEPTKSRFFPNNFITKVLFSTKGIEGSFLGVYENNKHLKEVYNNLKQLI